MERQEARRVRRCINLRKNRLTVVAGLVAGDEVRTVWDDKTGSWKLLVDSANGVTIQHIALTSAPPAA